MALINDTREDTHSRQLLERDLLVEFLVGMRRWVADDRAAFGTVVAAVRADDGSVTGAVHR